MKFAFVSHVLPPNWSGQSVVIHRVLSGINPDDYCLIAQDYGEAEEHRQQKGRLQAKHYYLPRSLMFMRGWRFALIRWVNIISRALQIARIIRRENCEAIVCCPGDFFGLPASYLASKLTGVKFYPYMLDYYSEQSAGFKSARFVRRFEPMIMRGATGIIVPNEFLQDELRECYGVDSVIVRNPCDVAQYEKEPPFQSNGHRGEFKIVFTGSIYNAHFDAFRNLLSAIKMLDNLNVKLHLYTNQTLDELEKQGISGPIVLQGTQEISAMPGIQRQADLLFLPLAFKSPFPKLIRTSAPGKTGEYLAASRPVLVHAPPDSFLAWYFRQHNCGVVVDESDPVKLAQAIGRILTDPELQQKLSANAWERARAEFSIRAAQSAFAKVTGANLIGQ